LAIFIEKITILIKLFINKEASYDVENL